jgi:outer membrane protein OmpA-like peptidoglycan-associated protein
MKARQNMSFAVAGTALILLAGCVSSRKYKTSQAELATARMDSAQLAQKDSALNANVNDLQGKNTTLQQSLDASNSKYTAQQKNLDYYQGYFKQQQDTMNQVSQDIKGALTQAGVANADVQQTNNVIYVRLDENDLFRKNSMMVTPAGKHVLDTVAQLISSRSSVNVTVASGDSAVAWTASDNMSANADMTPAPRHHTVHHYAASATTGGTQGSGNGAGNATATTSSTSSTGNSAPAHKKVHHHYSAEGSTAMYSGPGHLHNHAWALKQGRMVTVANHFLKNGVPKINLSLQQPPMNGAPGTTIKIIITPTMNDFNPQQNSSAAAGPR